MITTELKGTLSLKRQLQFLQMSSRQKQAFHRNLGKKIAFATRMKIKSQSDIEGKPFAPRRNGRKRMLSKITRSTHMKEFWSANRAIIKWPDDRSGMIAALHQHGQTLSSSVQDLRKEMPEPSDGMATKSQAKTLKKLGYKRAGAKKGSRRVASLKWITDNMSYDLANMLIMQLQGSKGAQRWKIRTPQRAFLGLTDAERAEMIEDIFKFYENKRRK